MIKLWEEIDQSTIDNMIDRVHMRLIKCIEGRWRENQPLIAIMFSFTIATSSLTAISIWSISVITVSCNRVESFSISSGFDPSDVIGNAPDVTWNSNWLIRKSFYSFFRWATGKSSWSSRRTVLELQNLDGLEQVDQQLQKILEVKFEEMEQMQLSKTVLL